MLHLGTQQIVVQMLEFRGFKVVPCTCISVEHCIGSNALPPFATAFAFVGIVGIALGLIFEGKQLPELVPREVAFSVLCLIHHAR